MNNYLFFRKFFFLITFLLLCFPVFSNSTEGFNYAGYTTLEEGWEFYPRKSPEQVFALIQNDEESSYIVSVPSFWNSIFAETDYPQPENYGCYHYKYENLVPSKKYALFMKESAGTSCAIYVNGNLVAQHGNPFEMLKPENQRTKKSCSFVSPLYCEFTASDAGEAEILVFVSNYYYRKGGLWDSVFLGTPEGMHGLYNLFLLFYSIISGILIFIGLLNLLQFIINKKHWEYFYLGTAAIVFSLRVATASFSTISIIMPFLPSEIEIKLEYLALWLAPIAIMKMLYILYPAQKNYIIFKWLKEKVLRYSVIAVSSVLGIISLVVPGYYSNRMVPVLQVVMGVISLYVVVYIIINVLRKRKYIIYYLVGCLFLIMGGAFDIVYTKSKNLIPLSLFPFFLVMFIFVQLILLATIQNDVYKDTVRITENLKKLNEAYLRFVPREFIKLLHKDSVISLKPGDYSDIQMCIMFSKLNIRSLKSNVSLDDHFLIFNEYLKYASPIIKKHGGFVSKFLSGGFMALFPSSEMEAVYAAIEIRDFVKDFALSSVCQGHFVDVRTGIHFGKMIAGTLGEAGRLDDTVISDTVNTVARIESVCERLGKNIIISQALEKMIDTRTVKLVPLEAIMVKGKSKPLDLYEVKTE